MLKRIIYNLATFFISIFAISTITFFLFELVPGDIYDSDLIKSEQIIVNIRVKMLTGMFNGWKKLPAL
jgi:ABC-type dipeptide/oligopeptide/nickel transport system permease component